MSNLITLLDHAINESIYCISPLTFNEQVMKHCNAESGQYTFHMVNYLSANLSNIILCLPKPYTLYQPLKEGSVSSFYSNDIFIETIQPLNENVQADCLIHSMGNSICDDLTNLISFCNPVFILVVQQYNDINVRKLTQQALKNLSVKKLYTQSFITKWPNSPIEKNKSNIGEQETWGNGLYVAVLKKI